MQNVGYQLATPTGAVSCPDVEALVGWLKVIAEQRTCFEADPFPHFNFNERPELAQYSSSTGSWS